MKSLNFIILFLLLTTLTACGSNENDTTRITVNTMFPVKSPASVDLSKTMFSMFTVPTPNCVQDQIMLGARNAVTKEMIQMKRVKVRSEVVINQLSYTQNVTDIPPVIDWMKLHSEIETPLVLDIPKGIAVDVGLFGHFFKPTTDANGNCALINGVSMQLASSINGNVALPANFSNNNINIRTEILHTNPGGPYPASTIIANSSFNWVTLPYTTSAAGGTVTLRRVRYLNMDLLTNTATLLYFPHTDYKELIFSYCVTSPTAACSYYRTQIADQNLSTITANLIVGDSNLQNNIANPPATITGTYPVTILR